MPVSIKVLGKKCIPKEWPFYWQKCNNPFDRLHSAISPLNLWNLIGGILFYKSAPLKSKTIQNCKVATRTEAWKI